MWQYEIFNSVTGGGVLTLDGAFQTTAYSGSGNGLNNVLMQDMRNVGPVPCGKYRMKPARFSSELGPLVIDLVPVGHDAFDRTDFRIHGDNKAHNGSASHGCIIAGPVIREHINKCIQAGHDELEVVP